MNFPRILYEITYRNEQVRGDEVHREIVCNSVFFHDVYVSFLWECIMAGIKNKQRNTLLREATGQTRTHHHNFTNTLAYAYYHQQNRGIILHLSYTTA
jgi:hypothetical protein